MVNQIMGEIAYIRIPYFAVNMERRAHALPPDLPLILFQEDAKGRRKVYSGSFEAVEAGVVAEMCLRQAEAICPEARVLPSDQSKYLAAFEKYLDRLTTITPDIEPDGLGQVYLDVSGLERLYGKESCVCRRLGRETWETARQWPAIGLADSKFVSRTAALRADPGHAIIVQQGAQREFLGELSVAYLPVGEEMQRQLRLLGISTIGQYATLPREAIANQFGHEGAWAHRLAHGHDESTLVCRHTKPQVTVERTFDEPINDIHILWAIAEDMVKAPLARLRARFEVCQTIRATLLFDNDDSAQRSLVLREPTAESSRMECLLGQLLRGFKYPCGVVSIKIMLEDISISSGHQLGLFANEQGQQNGLERIIGHLAGKYGSSRFYTAYLVDEGALLPERRFALEAVGCS